MNEKISVEQLNEELSGCGLHLEMREGSLTLTDGELALAGDFSSMVLRTKKSNLERELLVRAARIKGKPLTETSVTDATAGLGEDAMILAAAGFRVTMYERDPVIAALLRDAVDRAEGIPELREAASGMRLICGDSIAALRRARSPEEKPADVIFLDPMFPSRRKSALVKKKFQLLHHLERPCEDEEQLFEAAFGSGPEKIVVKRPRGGPHLAGRKPSYELSGKTIRYDCYVL